MLDINFIRENLEIIKKNLKKRDQLEKVKDVEQLLKLDGPFARLAKISGQDDCSDGEASTCTATTAEV